MAPITFYDVSPTDRRQLEAMFKDLADKCRFVVDSVSEDNINPDTEIISVFVSSIVDAKILDKMPKLKMIACRSTGFNNIDLSAAAERKITVTNVPTYGENTVAEYAFSLILALSRKLFDTKSAVNSAHIDPDELTGFDLSNKTLGIVGMGHIGVHMVQIAKGFGMKVVAYDSHSDKELAQKEGFSYVSLEKLMSQSDVVSLHVPYLPSTHHLINASRFTIAKKGMVLINTARGEIVDTKALIEALENKRVGAAGLDVLEGEKLLNIEEEILLLRRSEIPADILTESMEVNVLKNMPNVIVTPHNAYNTTEAIKRINDTTAKNIFRFLDRKPQNIVKPSAIKSGKLLLIRHSESEWNALGKWTGTTDVHLSEKGFHEATMFGQALKDIKIDQAFVSQQVRTLETLEGILNASQQFDVPYEHVGAFNERDYGDYTGKNKWEMRDLIGEDKFNKIRRDWNYDVPNGETLKMVYERAVPYYKKHVLPLIHAGKNVLIVSHGNSIRALMKYIEKTSDKGISELEMPFGDIIMYEVDKKGYGLNKAVRAIDTTPPNA